MAPICTQGHGVPSSILLVRGKREQAKRKLMKCNLVCQNCLIYQLTYSPGDWSRWPHFLALGYLPSLVFPSTILTWYEYLEARFNMEYNSFRLRGQISCAATFRSNSIEIILFCNSVVNVVQVCLVNQLTNFLPLQDYRVNIISF